MHPSDATQRVVSPSERAPVPPGLSLFWAPSWGGQFCPQPDRLQPKPVSEKPPLNESHCGPARRSATTPPGRHHSECGVPSQADLVRPTAAVARAGLGLVHRRQRVLHDLLPGGVGAGDRVDGNLAKVARAHPLGIRRSIGCLLRCLGVDVKNVLPAPTGRGGVVLVAALAPTRSSS